MTLSALIAVYFAIGAGSAALVARRSTFGWPLLGSLLATLFLWPLWLPFALGEDSVPVSPPQREAERAIASVLETAQSAASTTHHASLFSEADARAVRASVERIARRLDAIEAELGRLSRAPSRSALQARQLERLEALRAADAHALSDIRELLEQLVTELTLCQHAVDTDPTALLSELRARVEALSAV